MVISLEGGADLHMAQLMPLPLTHCHLLQQNPDWFYLSVLAHLGSPGKRAVKCVLLLLYLGELVPER